MIFKQVLVGDMQNFSYIIGDEKTKKAAVVDPAWEVPKLLSLCNELGLQVVYVINTHSHPDHVEGIPSAVERTGAKVIAYQGSRIKKDMPVKDGDIIELGSLKIRIIHTPGHCPDHICLLVDGKLLTGDTLFVGECGRTDLIGGNPGDLYDSLFKKILSLNDEVEVYPGHDYGVTPSSTIGHERRTNYVLKPRTKEEFVAFMRQP